MDENQGVTSRAIRRFGSILRARSAAVSLGFDTIGRSAFHYAMDQRPALLTDKSRSVRWLFDDIEATVRDPERPLATPIDKVVEALTEAPYPLTLLAMWQRTDDEVSRQSFQWFVRGLALQHHQ